MNQTDMKTGLKITAGVLLGIVVLIAALFMLAQHADWNRAKPWISERISEATGRSFEIRGDLSLDLVPEPDAQTGWRRWVPRLRARAQDVALGNPDWASTGPTMVTAGQVEADVGLLRLFQREIDLHDLQLTDAHINLERTEHNERNWQFPDSEQRDSAWDVDIKGMAITDGSLRYVDPTRKADATAQIDTREDGTVAWELGGTLNGDALRGGGTAGALLALYNSEERYPFEADVKIGDTHVKADGTISNPANPDALDIHLALSGPSMAKLYPIGGLVLPETPEYSTDGRIVGSLAPGELALRYENFKGKVGNSDISGTLAYLQQSPRSTLSGEVVSRRLDLRDLGSVVGAGDAKQDGQEQQKQQNQRPDKLLPASEFRSERWDKLDVQVTFSGEKIVRNEGLPLDDLNAGIKLENGVLILEPLRFGVAGGRLQGELSIDGRKEPAAARMNMQARGLKLSEMFPAVQEMRASLGQLNGRAQLHATGDSVASLLSSADGEVQALIRDGSISKMVLETIGLNVGSMIATKLFGDRQVQLNCMVADLGVKDGLMHARTFVVDTGESTIDIDGNIDFSDEQLNLVVEPDSKGMRIFSLHSPLYVSGTFKDPEVDVDAGSIALQAGAATALGAAAAPLTGLLALIEAGADEQNPCATLLAQVEERPSEQ